MHDLIIGLYEDWLWLDERIEGVTGEIEGISTREAHCRRLMSVPGIGPIISTAMVSAIGTGEAFERGRDFAAWLGLVPRQYSTGGKPISASGSGWRVLLRDCTATSWPWHWLTSSHASPGASCATTGPLTRIETRLWRPDRLSPTGVRDRDSYGTDQ
jgi:hypothetical protein